MSPMLLIATGLSAVLPHVCLAHIASDRVAHNHVLDSVSMGHITVPHVPI